MNPFQYGNRHRAEARGNAGYLLAAYSVVTDASSLIPSRFQLKPKYQKDKISRDQIDSIFIAIEFEVVFISASVLNQLKSLHVTPISGCTFMPLLVRNFTFASNICVTLRIPITSASPHLSAAIIQKSCFSSIPFEVIGAEEQRMRNTHRDLHVMNG